MRKAIYFDVDSANPYWECIKDSNHPHIEMNWPFSRSTVSPSSAASKGFKVYR
jgi:hypothetical protein